MPKTKIQSIVFTAMMVFCMVMWCRGCPAVANGTNGDFYGADPQCWKIKNERTGERLSC